MYSDLLSLILVLGSMLHAIVRIVWPCRASNGETSRTLTGMYVTAVFIFTVVMVDTLQDRSTASQTSSTSTSAASTPKAPAFPLGKRGGLSAASSDRSRTVLKEKYWILGVVFLCFAVLYLVSHRNEQVTRMVVWIVMAARRLNPFENDSKLDGAIVTILLENKEDPHTRQFALDYVLAKKGVKQDALQTVEITQEELATPVPPDNAGRFE